MENEEVPSAPSTPATPGTPGAPLFGGLKAERSGNGRRSLLKNCKCFSVEEWALEEGTLPKVSCSLPPPPIPLAKKVRLCQTTTLRVKIFSNFFISACSNSLKFIWTGVIVHILMQKTGWSWVHRHSHTDLCWDSHSHCEPKDTRLRKPHWLCCFIWPCCYGCHSLHWTYLRSPSQPGSHHCFCCPKALPMETCIKTFHLLNISKNNDLILLSRYFGRITFI